MWFEKLFGFEEGTMDNVRSKIDLIENRMRSKVNGKEFIFGELEIINLESLRKKTPLEIYKDQIKVEEVVGNVQTMHLEATNNGAIFQVASQFNLLEMISPYISPENGVGIYEKDLTQGPACAIACGAGTVFRNYFVNVNGQVGQSRKKQINCLDDLGQEFQNSKLLLWDMVNGYALANQNGLRIISKNIQSRTEKEYESLKGKLKVGIQWNSQVTLNDSTNLVSQVFCSALPVAYTKISHEDWELFARLILEATYEATLCAALINYDKTGNSKVYLTLVGGGAFGNSQEWIFDSMRKAIVKFKNTPLDLKIVSYGGSKQEVRDFTTSLFNN